MKEYLNLSFFYLFLSGDGCVCCVEHPYTTGVELKNKALFGVYANAIAGEFPAVIDKLHPVV